MNARVHAGGGKGFGALGEGVGGGVDGGGVFAVGGDGAQREDEGVDVGALLGPQQVAVGLQGAFGGEDEAVGFQPGFGQGAGLFVGLNGGEAVLQHAGNLLVRKAIAGLDVDLRLHAAGLLARADGEQPIGIHGEGNELFLAARGGQVDPLVLHAGRTTGALRRDPPVRAGDLDALSLLEGNAA